jgi:hypothetical protein
MSHEDESSIINQERLLRIWAFELLIYLCHLVRDKWAFYRFVRDLQQSPHFHRPNQPRISENQNSPISLCFSAISIG